MEKEKLPDIVYLLAFATLLNLSELAFPWTVIPCNIELAEGLLEDERFKEIDLLKVLAHHAPNEKFALSHDDEIVKEARVFFDEFENTGGTDGSNN